MKSWIVWMALCGMALARPVIRLTEGVGGGYAPTPNTFDMLVVAATPEKGYELYYKRLEKGTYHAWHKTLGDLSGVEHDLEQLGFFQLPQAAPNELDDIYRSETALQVRMGNHVWIHQPPVGCVRGRAKVQPGEAQLKIFRVVVARLKQLAAGGQECPVEEMTRAEIASRK